MTALMWFFIGTLLVVCLDILLRRRKAGAFSVADFLGALLYRFARFATGVAVAYDDALVSFRGHVRSVSVDQRSVRVLRGLSVEQGELF